MSATTCEHRSWCRSRTASGCLSSRRTPTKDNLARPDKFRRHALHDPHNLIQPSEIISQMNGQEKQLVDWLADMDEDRALELARRMLLEENSDPLRVLQLCRDAMDIVGKRFENGEYFLPELVLAGEMLDTIGAIAKPLIKHAPGEEPKKLGKVLIGTVHGDLHDIGKNIVSFLQIG